MSTRAMRTFLVVTAVSVAASMSLGFRSACAETIRISGTGGAIGTIRFLAEAFGKDHPDVRIEILPGMGSSGAIKAVLAGRLEIGLSGQALTTEEREQGGVERWYARTPFVFGANRSVKEENLTPAEVVAIYGGKKDRWKDGTRVRLIVRPDSDSDVPLMKSMSREMSAAVDSALHRKGLVVGMTDQDAADLIEKIPGSVGGTTLSLVISEKRPIRVLALDGVVPSTKAIVDGTYPYSKSFSMVTKRNAGPMVRRFVEFTRSPAGVAILSKYGQVAVR